MNRTIQASDTGITAWLALPAGLVTRLAWRQGLRGLAWRPRGAQRGGLRLVTPAFLHALAARQAPLLSMLAGRGEAGWQYLAMDWQAVNQQLAQRLTGDRPSTSAVATSASASSASSMPGATQTTGGVSIPAQLPAVHWRVIERELVYASAGARTNVGVATLRVPQQMEAPAPTAVTVKLQPTAWRTVPGQAGGALAHGRLAQAPAGLSISAVPRLTLQPAPQKPWQTNEAPARPDGSTFTAPREQSVAAQRSAVAESANLGDRLYDEAVRQLHAGAPLHYKTDRPLPEFDTPAAPAQVSAAPRQGPAAVPATRQPPGSAVEQPERIDVEQIASRVMRIIKREQRREEAVKGIITWR